MRLKYIVGVLLLTVACHANQKSELSHDAGRFLNSTDSRQWIAIDDFKWIQKESMGLPTFSGQHPMTQRLQVWADKIRENMLKSTPQLGVAPRPIVRIINSDEVNAYVSGSEVCVDLPMTTNPNNQSPGWGYLAVNSGSMYETTRPASCETMQGNIETQRAYVQWVLRDKAGCKVSSFAGKLALTLSCLGEGWTNRNFKGMSFYVTHNYITFYRALLEKMNEDEVVGVLAHELTHYYMGHLVAPAGQYYYFYQLEGQNSPFKPTRLPADHPLAALGARIQNMPQIYFQPMEGQTLHSLLYEPLKSIRYTLQFLGTNACLADKPDCQTICEPLMTHLNTNYDGVLSDFPYYLMLTDETKSTYAQYEREAQACLSTVKANSFESSMLSMLNSKVKYNYVFTTKANADDGMKFVSALSIELNNAVTTITRVLQNMVDEGTRSGLGWYTDEQEADEVGTEMVSRLGLNPMSVVSAELIFNDIYGTVADCRDQFAKGFPIPVSIGDYFEPHHDSCFRAANSYREYQAHEDYFTRFQEPRPVVQPELSWDNAVLALKTSN